MVEVFNDAGRVPQHTTLGDGRSNWKWGRIHSVLFRALLFPSFGSNQYNDGPLLQRWRPVDHRRRQPQRSPTRTTTSTGVAPSMRFACETDTAGRPAAPWSCPAGTGTSGDSPFRNNLVPGLAPQRTFPAALLARRHHRRGHRSVDAPGPPKAEGAFLRFVQRRRGVGLLGAFTRWAPVPRPSRQRLLQPQRSVAVGVVGRDLAVARPLDRARSPL
jgi:hypothetical protein